MKRSGPIQRRTPLDSGGELRRTPIARGKGLKRSGRVNPKRSTARRGRLVLTGEARRALRLAAYDRAGGRCEAGVTDTCPGRLSADAFEWHHRKLRSQGGDDVIENSLCLCHDCHEWAHQHPRLARDLGLIVPQAGDPAARPVTLADGRAVRLTSDSDYDVIFTAHGEAAA